MGWAERANPNSLVNGARYPKRKEKKAITLNPMPRMFPDPFAIPIGIMAALRMRKGKKGKKR